MGEQLKLVWVCDVCGFAWTKTEGKRPVQCPNQKCRSRRWDSGAGRVVEKPEPKKPPGLVAHADVPLEPDTAQSVAEKAKLARAVMAMAAASVKPVNENAPPKKPPVNELMDDAPEIKLCPYREYDRETGETYRCALPEHGPKVRHVKGEKVA